MSLSVTDAVPAHNAQTRIYINKQRPGWVPPTAMSRLLRKNHVGVIHPYPFTTGFESVASALWSASRPSETERHRAHILDIMDLAQAYLLTRLEGDPDGLALARFGGSAVGLANEQHSADKVEREIVTSGGHVYKENKADESHDSEIVDALRRLLSRRIDSHETPVIRFALAVAECSVAYYHGFELWKDMFVPGAKRLSQDPTEEELCVEEFLQMEAAQHVRGIEEAVDRFAAEVDACLASARIVFRNYVHFKTTQYGLEYTLPSLVKEGEEVTCPAKRRRDSDAED